MEENFYLEVNWIGEQPRKLTKKEKEWFKEQQQFLEEGKKKCKK